MVTVTREGKPGPRLGCPVGLQMGAGAFSIGSIRAQTIKQVLARNDLQKEQIRVEIYPSGIEVHKAYSVYSTPPAEVERGQITGFSDKAARRLRECFIKLFVAGYRLYSVTLTTHRTFTPNQWRDVTKRFRMAVIRAGWAGIWRVELQRRKTPHLHVAFYLPPGVEISALTDVWLQATGEQNDAAARKHAVVSKEIAADEHGWAVYMALHDGKHKEQQLGWVGKQWGIWNREAFTERTPEKHTYTLAHHNALLRFLANLDRSNRYGIMLARRAAEVARCPDGPVVLEEGAKYSDGDARFQYGIRPARPGEVTGLMLVRDPLKRPTKPRMHRGDLLRCVRGETVSRYVRALVEGKVSPSASDPF